MTASRRRLASYVCLALLLAATLLPGGPLLAVLPDGAVGGVPELFAWTIESFRSPALERPAAPHRERGPPAA